MPGTGLKIPDITPISTHRLDARRGVPKLTLSIYDLGQGQGFGIAYHDLESGQLTEDGYMVDNFSSPFESAADAIRAGSDAYVSGGRVAVDCTGFSELDPEEFDLPILETADPRAKQRAKVLSSIPKQDIGLDNAIYAHDIYDCIGGLLNPGYDRWHTVSVIEEALNERGLVDADIAVIAAMQRLGTL